MKCKFRATTSTGETLLEMQRNETYQRSVLKRPNFVEAWVNANTKDAYRDVNICGSLSLTDLRAGEALCRVQVEFIEVRQFIFAARILTVSDRATER
jgi:hypothetical protein